MNADVGRHACSTSSFDVFQMQPLDFNRVAWFARNWRDDASLSESTKLMAGDLVRLASGIQQSEGANASRDLSVRVITCYVCRFKYDDDTPPCCSEVCALYDSVDVN